MFNSKKREDKLDDNKKQEYYNKGLEYLNKYVEDKFVEYYGNYTPMWYANEYRNQNYKVAQTVYKVCRPMTISDLFTEISSEKQLELKKIFELEMKVMELEKLKSSIDAIKSYIKE